MVSEAGGGPWVNSPGLTEYLLSKWLGVQEDRGDGLRDIVIRKQEVLVRLAEVEEDDSFDSLGVDQGAGQYLKTKRTCKRKDGRTDTKKDILTYRKNRPRGSIL